MLNNTSENKKNMFQECVTTQPGRKKLRTSKHEKTELVVPEWLRWANSRSNVKGER
jgi:hypothetical protein